MNKYDWSNVPSHIMWIATNKNGSTYGYSCKPNMKYSFWDSNGLSNYTYDLCWYGNWQDSLEERPSD